MELNNRKKYMIRKFYDDYLDLNKESFMMIIWT